jgi:hypothetical protein
MKRAKELHPLSHDHHRALYAALLLSRAEEVEPARTEALAFWHEMGLDHLAIEEGSLLPGWISRDPDQDRGLALRVLREHLELRVGFRALENGPESIEEMNKLGRDLESHVRFEERELFPAIESRLGADALADLGAEIAEAR